MTFSRLVRFVPTSNPDSILIGEPVDAKVDVGAATRKGEEVEVRVFSGSSALKPGELTDKIEKIARVLSPVAQEEVGTIRCIGLNVRRIERRGRRGQDGVLYGVLSFGRIEADVGA